MTIGIIRKTLPLSVDRARQLLKYDKATGALYWRVKGRGTGIGKRAGAVCGNYRQICVDGVNLKEHRLIWFIVTGDWPECLVDHRDGDGLNNAWDNLRQATYAENAMNRRPGKRNRSGHTGVFWNRHRERWSAEICRDGRNYRIGCFETKGAAIKARCDAARHHFGSFAADVERYSDAAE
ncbi:MAG: HNH endonuclease [Gammaproteobacteria bacterium]|nr:HNH endonuclease [Gammaproteobacteria bacterium]